jgi:hypothetical protein
MILVMMKIVGILLKELIQLNLLKRSYQNILKFLIQKKEEY